MRSDWDSYPAGLPPSPLGVRPITTIGDPHARPLGEEDRCKRCGRQICIDGECVSCEDFAAEEYEED